MKNKDLHKQFNLPSYVKGKSFSEATKLIQNKFKDRNDDSSKKTMQELLSRLKQAQEYVKQQSAPPVQEQPPMVDNIPQPNMDNQMADGGELDVEKKQTSMPNIGGYATMASGAMDAGQQIFGATPEASADGQYDRNGGGAVKGAAKGAQAGAALGPWGMAAGAVIGGVAGVIGSNKQNKAIDTAKTNRDMLGYNQQMINYAYGGNIGDPTDPTDPNDNKKDNNETKDNNLDPSVPRPMTLKTEPDFITLPNHDDENVEDNLRLKYAAAKKLNNEQLGGFENQQLSDKEWVKNRDLYYSNSFKNWKKQKTGQSLNSDYSQSSPEYQQFWKDTKKTWYKENPRQINDIVQSYAAQNKKAYGGNINKMYDGGDPNDPFNLGTILSANNTGNVTDYGRWGKGGSEPSDINASLYGADEYKGDVPQVYKYNEGNNYGLDEQSEIDMKADDLEKFNNFNNLPSNNISPSSDDSNNDNSNKVTDTLGRSLRYAPALMNAFQLAKMKRPDQERLSRLGNRYDPQYMDEKRLTNSVNESFNEGANVDAAGGSLSRLASLNNATQLNKTKALSEAYARSSEVNRNEKIRGQEFNLNVDRTNLGQDNREREINAQNEGAYNTEKSKLLGQIGTDLGQIGKEEKYKQMVKESGLCYDSRGAYQCGDGTRLTEEQVAELRDKKSDSNEKKYSGNIDSGQLFTSYFESLLNKKNNNESE